MPERAACQSGLAWARRPRRLTPLPWPSPRAPALEAAEDGHVEGRPRRRAASTTCFVAGGSTVRRELLLHGGHRALAGVDAGRVPEKDPRLPFLDRVQHVVQCGHELQERRRRGPAVKHRTSVTFMMCSFSRVMSAGDSMLLLPRVSARGALRFQR